MRMWKNDKCQNGSCHPEHSEGSRVFATEKARDPSGFALRMTYGLTFLLFLAACRPAAKVPTELQSAGPTDTFVWNNYAEPATVDPGLVQENASHAISMQIFEGLTNYDPKTLEPVPGVATRWEVSADGIVYTYHLRDTAKWSDGKPVTAKDFEYAWKRTLDPKTGAQYAFILYFIKNAEEYNSGKLADASKVGVKAIDPKTLRVTLKEPTPFFPQLTSFYTYAPVPRWAIESWGEKWTRPEHIVCNGYYKLVSWIPQKEVLLEKNPFYWDAANVRIPKIKFLPIEDRETALKMHLNGAVHYSEDIPSLKLPGMSKRPDFHNSVQLATYYYQLNITRKPLDDVRVRQALAMAIDRKQITAIMQKGDIPTTHLTPPMPGYEPPEGFPFDPVRAKELLTEAGYADPKTFPSFSIVYNTSEDHKKIAELVQAMWKKNLGINVTLQNMEWKVLVSNYIAKNFEIGRMTWQGDFQDPFTFLSYMTADNPQNGTHWSNPQYDDLVLNQSAREKNRAKRAQIMKQAESILLQEAPIIPFYHLTRPFLLDPRVKGFYGNVMDMHPMKFVYFE